MDSEKATAGALRALGSNVFDALIGAATTAPTGQARRINRNQKTAKSRRKEKHRRRTNSVSLRQRWVACVRARGHCHR